MNGSPFGQQNIRDVVRKRVLEVQADLFAWIADPSAGNLDATQLEFMVRTLDAHAESYLQAVDHESLLPQYEDVLRQTGAALIHKVQTDGPYNDRYSEEKLRRVAEGSLLSERSSLNDNDYEAKVDTVLRQIRDQCRDDALSWNIHRDQILLKIEAQFEGRYRHWTAKALERVRQRWDATTPVDAESETHSAIELVGSCRTLLGGNIDRLRVECGWSFDDLSKKTEIYKKLIVGHVKHGKSAYPSTLRKYADAFSKELGRNVSVAELKGTG